ncbi:MAG TPA: DUF2945 domain-containing protein [Terriglobales bacterium]
MIVKRMAKVFKRGDHVEWNSEAGRVRGKIVKKVVADVRIKGYVHHATKNEPHRLFVDASELHNRYSILKPSIAILVYWPTSMWKWL